MGTGNRTWVLCKSSSLGLVEAEVIHLHNFMTRKVLSFPIVILRKQINKNKQTNALLYSPGCPETHCVVLGSLRLLRAGFTGIQVRASLPIPPLLPLPASSLLCPILLVSLLWSWRRNRYITCTSKHCSQGSAPSLSVLLREGFNNSFGSFSLINPSHGEVGHIRPLIS